MLLWPCTTCTTALACPPRLTLLEQVSLGVHCARCTTRSVPLRHRMPPVVTGAVTVTVDNRQVEGQRIAQVGSADNSSVDFTDLTLVALPGPVSLIFTGALPYTQRVLAPQQINVTIRPCHINEVCTCYNPMVWQQPCSSKAPASLQTAAVLCLSVPLYPPSGCGCKPGATHAVLPACRSHIIKTCCANGAPWAFTQWTTATPAW
jgi:hypothetical protein